MQCLCPHRHCIAELLAGPKRNDLESPTYRTDEQLCDDLRGIVEAAIHRQPQSATFVNLGKRGQIRHFCEICGAPPADWCFEVGISHEFPSWKDAKIHFAAVAELIALTKEAMYSAGMSYAALYDANAKATKN